MTTRDASSAQESHVAHLLNGKINANSGAGKWRKGDVQVPEASLLIECKTCMSPKESFSIKKEWIKKNIDEAHSNRLFNSCIAFNYAPYDKCYFVIDEKLMKFLVEKLIEEN